MYPLFQAEPNDFDRAYRRSRYSGQDAVSQDRIKTNPERKSR
ncbi:unnamed protein product, partial [marine sediment metagenome]